jgi:hypothetical protein
VPHICAKSTWHEGPEVAVRSLEAELVAVGMRSGLSGRVDCERHHAVPQKLLFHSFLRKRFATSRCSK